MSKTSRKTDFECPDPTKLTDFQLLQAFTELVSKERSHPLHHMAWEIMRRYTTHLAEITPNKEDSNSSSLGDTRWGDAKRAETIFGMKRGVLNSLSKHGLIKSKTLDQGRQGTRAKRLYDLISIESYLEANDCIATSSIT